jgi:hypothetical protein
MGGLNVLRGADGASRDFAIRRHARSPDRDDNEMNQPRIDGRAGVRS